MVILGLMLFKADLVEKTFSVCLSFPFVLLWQYQMEESKPEVVGLSDTSDIPADALSEDLLKFVTPILGGNEKNLHLAVTSWIQDNVDQAVSLADRSLAEFLRLNWTGPAPALPGTAVRNSAALIYLGEDEPAYRLCNSSEQLATAWVLLEQLIGIRRDLEVSLLYSKACWMRQSILPERSTVLMQKVICVLDRSSGAVATTDDDKVRLVELLLLGAHLSAFYYDYTKSKSLFILAQKLANVPTVLTGVLGKKTRFQEKEYAQLVVSLTETNDDKTSGAATLQSNDTGLPVNVALDDDTLLDQTKLSSDVPYYSISGIQAATILTEGILLYQKHAKQNLQDEEIDAFVQFILQSHPPYAIQACALYHRSKLEVTKSRKTARAMQQLESLMAAFRTETPPPSTRTALAAAVHMPPFWKVEEELGFALLANGCVKEAVNIFTSLELWEDVIECYQRIGQKVKAEDLILKELAKQETPSMWCRLGGLREDVDYYQKAWLLSKRRNFRSRKDLGRLYVKRQQYQDAVRVLREGLDVNAVDPSTWFLLGYALLKVGELGSAEVAFRRCVNLDPENSLAWNNLGSIALQNEDYPRAYKVLQDAVKNDFENWNIWDNYQNACQHVKDFEEELKSCYRLLELRGQLNTESLALLVAAVMDGVPDIHGMLASRLYSRVKELFGAITAKLADNSRIWFLYGKLQNMELNGKQIAEQKEILESMTQKYQRAYRYSSKEKDWEKDDQLLVDVLAVAKELGDTQIKLMNAVENEDEKRSIRSSVRVMLDNVITKVKRGREDSSTGYVKLPSSANNLWDAILKLRHALSS